MQYIVQYINAIYCAKDLAKMNILALVKYSSCVGKDVSFSFSLPVASFYRTRVVVHINLKYKSR